MSMPRPNILLITCHDLGRWLGCYGVSTLHTPNLDRLAAEGARFTQAFCTAPQCSPSRASLFTGRYPHANGVLGLTHGDFGWDLLPAERHLGQLLGGAGYAATLVGVMHEARDAARCGMAQVLPEASGAETTRAALAELARRANGGEPFYLQVGYHEPHRVKGPSEAEHMYMGFTGGYIAPDDARGVSVPPYLVDEPSARVELAELQGAVRHLDDAIGGLLDGLRSLGLAERTLVLFTTDHGPALPRAKASLYDPGLAVALILRSPVGDWGTGRVIDALVSNVDIVPTLLDALGVPAPGNLHGRTLLPLLAGAAAEARDTLFAELTYHDYYDPRRCVRTERHKLIVNFTTAPAFMDPSQSWRPRTRPVVPADPATAFHPLVELYDLMDDPNEWDNRADDPAQAATRQTLLTRLHNWMISTNDPLLTGAVTSPTHVRAVVALTSTRPSGERP